MPVPAPTSLVVQLTIDLSDDPGTLAALSDLLDSVAALPGIAVSVPAPREEPTSQRLRILPYARTVLRGGRAIPLTRLEFDLLLYLVERPRRVVARHTLMADVWGIGQPLNSRTVDVHIRRLRDKLGAEPRIATVRGVGYRFDGVREVVVEQAPENTRAFAGHGLPSVV